MIDILHVRDAMANKEGHILCFVGDDQRRAVLRGEHCAFTAEFSVGASQTWSSQNLAVKTGACEFASSANEPQLGDGSTPHSALVSGVTARHIGDLLRSQSTQHSQNSRERDDRSYRGL